MDIVIPTIPWVPLLPHTILAVAGTAILLADCFLPRAQRGWLAALALAGVAAAALAVRGVGASPAPLLGGMVVADGFARFFHLVYLMVAALTILLSAGYLHREELEHGEYYALILFATLGMMIMAGSLDLITIFLGLETLSIPLYILAGFQRTADKSNESAIKYLLLGAFATGFFLYGVALVYGATGTTKLAGVAGALKAGGGGGILLSLGAGLLVVGLGFKVAAVPFHMWTPDVYEGAPTSVTAFMIAGTKAAAFAALLRVLFFALPSRQADWVPILSVLAVLTMIVGNVAAIAQQNIKRMLAYSSIAHAGYVLVALASAGTPDAVPNAAASALFYLIVYALMNLGAFAVIIALTERGETRLGIADFAGLGARHPFLGCAMAIFMLSLAGFPPTGGFMGKFYIFSAAVQGHQVGLAVVGVLTSVISVYYYLRVTVVMYMREPAAEPGRGTVTPGLVLAAAVAAVGTLYLGLFPARWWELAQQSVKALLG
jgi:NADH-quinone oxidoreductase subunit N